jgi:hypothetical protein
LYGKGLRGGVPTGVDVARLVLLQVDLSHYLRHLSPLIHVYAGGLLQDNWQEMTEVLEKKLRKSAICPSRIPQSLSRV